MYTVLKHNGCYRTYIRRQLKGLIQRLFSRCVPLLLIAFPVRNITIFPEPCSLWFLALSVYPARRFASFTIASAIAGNARLSPSSISSLVLMSLFAASTAMAINIGVVVWALIIRRSDDVALGTINLVRLARILMGSGSAGHSSIGARSAVCHWCHSSGRWMAPRMIIDIGATGTSVPQVL